LAEGERKEKEKKKNKTEQNHLKLSGHQNHLGSWLKIQIPKCVPSQ
jgi:hypothetical protein